MFDVTEDGNFAADGGMAARFGIDDMTNGLAVYADGAIYVGGRVLDTGAPATGWTDTTRLIRIERIGSTFSILQETTAGSGAFTTVHTVQDYTSSNAIRIGSGGMNSRTNVSWTALNGMGTVELPHGKEIAIAPTAGDDRIEGTTDDDTIDGGAGDDRIAGNAGNDTINGGDGNDTLDGGAGDDTYVVERDGGADTIINTGEATSSDTISFGAGIEAEQLWFQQVGDDLKVSIIGTSDTTTIDDWYVGSDNQVSSFETSEGSSLLASQVANLVSTMNSFSPPAVGELNLDSTDADDQTVLAAIDFNWQNGT